MSTPPEGSAGRRSIDDLLSEARRRLKRYDPSEAHAAQQRGAYLVDIRPAAQRAEEGEIPGALIVERNVLEWRFDPLSPSRLPDAARYDAEVVVFCSEGYTSSLAAASLKDMGLSRATDVDGGFQAWKRAGLPVTTPLHHAAAGRDARAGAAAATAGGVGAEAVVLDPEIRLDLDGLLAIALGRPVAIATGAEARLARASEVIEAVLAAGTRAYGLNTGLGHSRDDRVDSQLLADYQLSIVRLHAGALGSPLRTEIVRGAMAARLNSAVRGGSGLRRGTVDLLAAMLNRGVHPVVPEIGSVGASDLGHMAAIGLVVIGSGQAEVGGRVLPGRDALAAVGLEPVVLQPMEGLAIISANSVAVGHGAFVAARAARAVEASDVVAAVSFEAIGANLSVIDPAVGAAKGIAGQVAAISHLRALLEGSSLFESGAARSLQDPLSFRVVPQVHGAAREFVAAARAAVETELNASDDNPLVVADGRMVSNGNFHPMAMALSFDAVRTALAHVALLSSRRMSHLTRLAFQGRDAAFPVEGSGLRPVNTTYSAAALYAELRFLAGPATLDVPSLDLEQEDHATAAPLSVSFTEQLIGLLERILAVELDFAVGLLDRTPRERRRGRGVEAIQELVSEATSARDSVSTAQVNEALWRLVASDELRGVAQAAR